MTSKVVILDRDGVINHDSPDYIKTPDEWQPIAGSLEAIAQLTRNGYRVFVATNQAGIGRGIFSSDTLADIHRKMQIMVAEAGGELAGIAHCPHQPSDNCECRKPKPGLLRQIATRYGVTVTGQPFVGDSTRDVEAAIAGGCEAVIVLTGNGKLASQRFPRVQKFDDLLAYTNHVLSQ